VDIERNSVYGKFNLNAPLNWPSSKRQNGIGTTTVGITGPSVTAPFKPSPISRTRKGQDARTDPGILVYLMLDKNRVKSGMVKAPKEHSKLLMR
jgi:hypothetical protein